MRGERTMGSGPGTWIGSGSVGYEVNDVLVTAGRLRFLGQNAPGVGPGNGGRAGDIQRRCAGMRCASRSEPRSRRQFRSAQFLSSDAGVILAREVIHMARR